LHTGPRSIRNGWFWETRLRAHHRGAEKRACLSPSSTVENPLRRHTALPLAEEVFAWVTWDEVIAGAIATIVGEATDDGDGHQSILPITSSASPPVSRDEQTVTRRFVPCGVRMPATSARGRIPRPRWHVELPLCGPGPRTESEIITAMSAPVRPQPRDAGGGAYGIARQEATPSPWRHFERQPGVRADQAAGALRRCDTRSIRTSCALLETTTSTAAASLTELLPRSHEREARA